MLWLLKRAIEQVNGREGETATLFGRCPLPLGCAVAVSPHVISTVRRLPLKINGRKEQIFLLMTNTILKLSQVLESAEQFPYESDLFLPKDKKLNQNTKCAVLAEDDNFEFTEETLWFAETHGLKCHFGIQLVQDVVINAKLQKLEVSVDELVIALEYYLEYDAFYDFGNLYG